MQRAAPVPYPVTPMHPDHRDRGRLALQDAAQRYLWSPESLSTAFSHGFRPSVCPEVSTALGGSEGPSLARSTAAQRSTSPPAR